MVQFVVYYRVSTKGQGESGLGMEAQRAYIKHFIKPEQIAQEYEEVASAKYLDGKNRPKLAAAIRLCNEHNYTLAIAKIDRLSRMTEHALEIYSRLDGRLFSCDVPHLDKFTLTLFMAIADRERELIGLRTKAALDQKRLQCGEWRVSNLSDEAREKARKAIKEKALNNDNNKRAMELCLLYREKGLTLQKIAEKLNSNGFRTSRGTLFHKTSVNRLLARKKDL